MAVNDVGFYNVIGEFITRTELVEQMINYYNLKLGEGETRVTDFNEGSEIRNLLEAIAVDMYILMQQVNEAGNIAFIQTAEGFWLDKHGANPYINLPRVQGAESTGEVVFTLANPSETIINIPAETILVSESTGLEFITNMDCVIYPNETSNTVNCTSATRGADTNVPANDINIILDLTLPNDLTVTNPNEFTGGVDVEDDDVYRERLLNYVRRDDFGSIGYYTGLLENVTGVHDVVLTDVNGYTKKAIINGFEKPVNDTVLLECLSILTDPGNIVMGHTFTVAKPNLKVLNLTVNLDVTTEYSNEQLLNVLETYINGGSSDYIIDYSGYNIGEDLLKKDLLEMFHVFDKVVNVNIIDNNTGYTLNDIIVANNEVLSVGEITFNQTIVE